MMQELNWTVFGCAAGIAFIAVGTGMHWAYGEVRDRRDGDSGRAPQYLPLLFGKFTRAALLCLLLGAVIVAAAFLLGPGLSASGALRRAPVTLYYAAALGLLLVVLTFNVLRHRVRALLQNFGKPDPVAERIVRVHGNFAEYVPTGLALMLVVVWAGAPAFLVHFGGAVFTVGRYLHAWGLTRSDGASFGRIAGIQATLFGLAYLVSVACIYLFFI
jgi:hypothetical protein